MNSPVKLLPKTALSMYILFLLWLVLFKFSLHIPETFDFHIRGLSLIPFSDITKDGWRDVIYNFVFFVPLGMLLGVNLRRTTFRRKLLYIFLFSLSIELIQFIFAIGITDITDLATNTSGGLLGLSLYGLNARHLGSQKVDRWTTVTTGTLAVFLFVFMIGLRLSHDRHRPVFPAPATSSAEAADPQLTLDKNIQLAWPSVGQAAVGNLEEEVLVRSSDNEKPRPTASMAKVITALAIMEKQPLSSGQTGQTYTIAKGDIANLNAHIAENGSVLPLRIGMELTQYEAIQRMLIASDNNTADILAERTFGSKQAYLSYANEMLQRMGLSQTKVADASGLSPATVSTPSELVAIGIAALKNPVIAEIVAQQHAQLPGIGVITNTNQLLGDNGVIGIKTGTTDEAGSCLLFAARYADENGKKVTIVGVIMGDTDHSTLYSDSRKLLASAKQGFGLVGTQPVDSSIAPQSSLRDRVPR